MVVFLDETNFGTGKLRNTDGLLCGGWASSKLVKP